MTVTIEGLREFARGQGRKKYNYSDNKTCAFGQYLASLGRQNFMVFGHSWSEDIGNERKFHHMQEGIGDAVAEEPHTFSALAKRLAKL